MKKKSTLAGVIIIALGLLVFILGSRERLDQEPKSKTVLKTEYLDGYYTDDSIFNEPSEHSLLLFNHRPESKVLLLGLDGELKQSFVVQNENNEGIHITKYFNGDFYSVVQVRGIRKVSATGEMQWWKPIGAHHDLAFDEEGNIYTLDLGPKKRKLGGVEIELFDDYLVKLSPTGEELKRVSLFSHLEPFLTNSVIRDSIMRWKASLERPDTFHVNSLFRLSEDVSGLGKEGDVLISVRDLNLIVLLNKNMTRVTWSYTSEELQQQHHVTVTPEGKILIFDNGVKRERSRVLLLDPNTKKIVWQYAPNRKEFYTKRHGSAQLLPNGNILVGLGRAGMLYEITPEKNIAAKFLFLSSEDNEEFNPYRVTYISTK